MKKLTSYLLIAAMLLALMPFSVLPALAATASGTCGDNLTWTYNNGSLVISGNGEMTSAPWQSYPYYYGDELECVTIGEGVTSIAYGAFQDNVVLESVTFPSTLKTINQFAFQDCEKLNEIVLPEGLTTIKGNAFYGCEGVTKIVIPSTVTTIDGNAFGRCLNVTQMYFYATNASVSCIDGLGANTSGVTLVFGSNVKTAPAGMFWCGSQPQIKKIIFQRASSLTTIGRRAFYDLTGLETVIFGNSSSVWANVTIGEGNTANADINDLVKFHTACSWTNRVVVKAATCTQSGTYTESCSVCYLTRTGTIDALGHSCSDWSVVTPPECEAYGNSKGVCTRCSATVYKQIDPTGHSYGDWENVLAPTCVTTGSDRRICTVCGDVETKTIDALGHSFGDWFVSVEPTCVANGETKRICAECKKEETKSVDALGHNYVAEVTDPTCAEQGFTTYTCSACSDSYVDSYRSALGHNPSKEATCTEEQICLTCGITLVDALGHNYVSVVTDATCVAQGYTTHTCSACGDSYIDGYTRPNGHSYVSVVTAPTCSEQGYTTYTCSGCGDTYIDSYVTALGHTECAEATCTEDQVCTECGEVLVEALGHTEGAEATCTEDQVCTVCGEVLVEALGHTEGAEATCTEDQVCTECGEVLVEALGHTEGEWKTLDDGSKELRCTVCGELLDAEAAPSFATGDVNKDGEIDMFDYAIVKKVYFELAGFNLALYPRADVDGDGEVTAFDYLIVKKAYFNS